MRFWKFHAVILPAILVMLLFALFFTTPASAQPPLEGASKEISKQTYGQIEKKLITPPKKPAQVKEEEEEGPPEGPTFIVKSITLEGVTAFPVEDFKPIIAKYENKETSVDKLKILCKEIEREYLKKGVISACFLPPQDVQEGKVTLRVVEAKMGTLDVKKARWFSAKSVENYWTIPAGQILRYDKISRILQFLNKNPDRTVKAALHAGKKPETTDVTMEMQTNAPVHLTAMFDREGVPSTGKARKGFGFVDNNFFGIDDTLLGGYTGGKAFGGIYIYHRLPITYFGTSILYGYSKSKSFPQKDYAPFEISSTQENYSVYAYQDLFYKDEYKGEISFGIEANNKRVVSGAGGDLNVDRLRIVGTSMALISKGHGNSTTFKPSLYQGINGLGALRLNEFSSRDAENTFTRLMLDVGFRQAFIKNFQANIKFSGQLASEKLTPQQELYIGGIDSVRGYPSGDYLADTGFYSQMELLIPAFFIPEWVKFPYGERPIKDEITGVAFFDCGYGYKRGEIQGEQTFRRMASLGLGVRVRGLNQGTVRWEVGVPLNPVVDGPLTEWSRSRVHISIDFQDDMPEEADRFRKVYREEYIKDASWRILKAEMKRPGSPLAKAIYSNLYLAKSARSLGKLEDARKYYAQVSTIGNNVFRQTSTYLKERYEYADQLRKANLSAEEYYKNCEYEKARDIWQKIVTEAKTRPLVLEFLQE